MNILYLRTVYSCSIPFLYYFSMSLWLYILMQRNILRKNKKFYYTLGIFLLMYLFPGLVGTIIKSIVCKEIDG